MYQIIAPRYGDCSAQKYTSVPIWILFLDILLYGMELSYFSPFSSPQASQAQGQHFTEAHGRKRQLISMAKKGKDHNHSSSPSLPAKDTTHGYHCQDIRYCLVK